MSFEWFHPQDFIILIAIGWIGGLIIAAQLSVRLKRDKTAKKPSDKTAKDDNQTRMGTGKLAMKF